MLEFLGVGFTAALSAVFNGQNRAGRRGQQQ